MTYADEMRVLTKVPLGMFHRELCEIFWMERELDTLKTGRINQKFRFA
jgi:hypothetical protein